jgi:hypothetical protein
MSDSNESHPETSSPATPPATAPSVESLFAAALRRIRAAGSSIGGPALAGAMLVSNQVASTGCAELEVDITEQADWAQYEGQRNTEMVQYTGGYWSQCLQPNTRFGCGNYEIFLKVRVRPVVGANLDAKRVGVVWKSPWDKIEKTAIGHYAGSAGNGDEEWHVPVSVQTWQKVILFDVWYQDGAGSTYYDDNQGELHVVNDGASTQVLSVESWRSTVTVGDDGVQGTLSLQLSDLDYDKQVVLVGTTDGWQTSFELGIGSAGDKNAWYWAEDYAWSDRERWQIDLDLPGSADSFEYAVLYRHGVVNGARSYAFWDNNWGANYRVDRVSPGEPVETAGDTGE